MALLLNIDTATSYGGVAVSNNGRVISAAENRNQKDHAAFLHTAIAEVLLKSGESLAAIDAVVITIGPGSYTGLRVGLSAAKGLCYTLQKPLIAVSTLQAIALAASKEQPVTNASILYVPMIDARRMEVFTAVYDAFNSLYTPATATIIDESFLAEIRSDNFLVFCGDGSEKLKQVLPDGNYSFSSTTHNIQHVANIGEKRFMENLVEDIAYCEPIYLKPFFSTAFVKR